MLFHSNSQSSSPNMSTSPSPTYTMMLEREDDSQKWFELATDSEAEEAQKSYFFDNLNWESLNHTADDSSPTSPFEIGNSECKSFMSQNRRSPEPGLRKIETKGSSAGMKNHTSERTQDNEYFVSSHGQPSCSYNMREELPKEQSRACCEPLEQYDNKRGLYSTSQLGTDNSCRGENVYRKRHPSGKSPGRSSRDEDVRQDNNDVADWERCRVLDSEGSSYVALDSKYADEDARRKRVDKEEKSNKVMDECALAELGISQDCPSGPDLRIPMSSMDDRKFMSTTVGGPESHLKEMTTQQKRRILINTSSNGPCLDSSFERLSYPYGSPERCWVKAQCKKIPQEDHSPSVTHTSGLPRSTRGNTSSRNSVGCGSTLYRSPNMATPVEAQPDRQRKASEDGITADSLRNFKENDNDHFKISSEREPQRPLQGNTEYDQESLTFDSRFLKRLNKISGVAHLDHDERVSQSSTALDLAEPSSPTVNVELNWKVEELERLVADERKKFHAVTERLAEQQEEADKNAQQMQDDWDGKIRELQKEKYDLSIRLQSTETAHLASLLAGRESKAQSVQSGMQPGLSLMPSASSSISHRRVSSHRHHEEFLKELEADQFRGKSGSMKAPQITEQEARKLKQEILQQEVLIRGYQHENEKAMQKIKEVQAEAKEKARIVTEENSKLASQLLQCQRRGMASGPQAATELSLQEALDREAQLKRLDVQLKQEIARLKDELTKAHAELERVEKKVSKTLDDLESELASLKNSLTEERENHTRTSLTKEEVTKSLEENQRLLSALQATTEQQAAQILELSSKVATYEGDGANLDKVGEEDRHVYLQDKRGVLVDDRRRIQPTLKQVRKPDVGYKVGKSGLSALAQVSRDESEKVRKLQMELAIQRKQSNTKEEETNRRLNMLKLELEKSKQEYEKRLQSLQATHPHVDSASASEQVAHNRVKSLETQVVNIRIHYSRKLKELTEKLTESKNEQNKLKVAAENAALQKKMPATRTVKDARLQGRILGGASLNVKELMDAKERIGILEDVLDHRDHTIKGLQHKLGQVQIDGKGDDTSAANSITAKQVASLAKIKSKIQSGSPQRGRPTQSSLQKVRDSEESTHASPEPSGAAALVDNHEGQDKQKSQRDQDSPIESEPDIVSLRKQLGGTEVNRDSLQQQCLEAMEKAARCSITHQQSLHHLQQASKMNMENHTVPRNFTSKRSASGDVDWRSYNDPLERENRALQAREKFRSMVFSKQ